MKKVFALTGSGISVESGIQTYRGEEGLWEEHAISDVATPEGFRRNPDLVRRFYDDRSRFVAAATPNAAHLALARLGDHPGFSVTIVTQNIDDLHERAGSKRVLHIHGAVTRAVCGRCGERMDEHAASLVAAPPCPECAGAIRPDITWFGEMPQRMLEIEEHFMDADLFLMIGTSGQVMPAGDYARRARNRRLKRCELNMRQTDVSHHFRGDWRRGHATTVVPAYVAELIVASEST